MGESSLNETCDTLWCSGHEYCATSIFQYYLRIINVRVGLNLLQPFAGGMRVVQITNFVVAVTMYGTVTDIVVIGPQTLLVFHQTSNL